MRKLNLSPEKMAIIHAIDNPKIEENLPCAKCGRKDLPLHFNRQCPECYTPVMCPVCNGSLNHLDKKWQKAHLNNCRIEDSGLPSH